MRRQSLRSQDTKQCKVTNMYDKECDKCKKVATVGTRCEEHKVKIEDAKIILDMLDGCPPIACPDINCVDCWVAYLRTQEQLDEVL